jgi:hypothetical protein
MRFFLVFFLVLMLLLLQFFFWLFSLSRNACHFLPCTYLVVYLSISLCSDMYASCFHLLRTCYLSPNYPITPYPSPHPFTELNKRR